MRRLVLPVLALALAGCSRAPTPLGLTGEQLMVHSLLVAGSDTVQVLVTRTLPAPEPDPGTIGGSTQTRPVSAADVRLVVDGAAVQLREAPEGFPACRSQFPFRVPRVDSIRPGCYAAVLPARVRPGQRYRLEVRVNGGVVEGSTGVPRAPEIQAPEAGARFRVQLGTPAHFDAVLGVPVRYRVPPEVAGVRVTLAVDSLYRDRRRIAGGACIVNERDLRVRRTEPVDSATLTVLSMHCSQPGGPRGPELVVPDSIFARVLVAGFDSTYVRYAEAAHQDSAERSRLRAGIEGALGVFAGAGIAALPVVLVPDTARAR